MSEMANLQAVSKVSPPPAGPVHTVYQHSLLRDREHYNEQYNRSLTEPDKFWAEMAQNYHWHKKVQLCRAALNETV